jgi:hypothetical protein
MLTGWRGRPWLLALRAWPRSRSDSARTSYARTAPSIRAALARIVFSDRTARADLEAIVHPDVYRRIREWFAQLPHGTTVAMADIPLLFETGHEHDFDAVVVAACTPEEQLRRLVARDGLSETDARARLEAQSPIDEKVRRAQFVIRTDTASRRPMRRSSGSTESWPGRPEVMLRGKACF